MILTGRLAPGEILRDTELATMLGVSNTPVREAVAVLASEGLIDMPPYRTKRVAPLDKAAILEELAILRILARSAYELGIPHISDEGISRMRDILRQHRVAAQEVDRDREFELSLAFHDEILAVCGNRKLAALVRGLQISLRRPTHLAGLFETASGQARQGKIMRAVAARDAATAIDALVGGHDALTKAITKLDFSPAAQAQNEAHDLGRTRPTDCLETEERS